MILNNQPHALLAILLQINMDHAVRITIIDRILKQVVENSLHLLDVAVHHDLRLCLQLIIHPLLRQKRLKFIHKLFHHHRHIDHATIQAHMCKIHTGQLEEFIDKILQTSRFIPGNIKILLTKLL